MRRLRDLKPESELEVTAQRLLHSREPYQPEDGAQERVWRRMNQFTRPKKSRVLLLLQPITVGMLLCGLVAGATAMVGKTWIAEQVANIIHLVKTEPEQPKSSARKTVAPSQIAAPPDQAFHAPPTLDPLVNQIVPDVAVEPTVSVAASPARFPLSHRARREAALKSDTLSPPESSEAASASRPESDTAHPVEAVTTAETPVVIEDREQGQTQKILDAIRTLRRDHDSALALHKFESYLRDFPDGVYVEEALGFAMEAAFENHDTKASELAQRYSREFAHGRFQSVARKILHQTIGH